MSVLYSDEDITITLEWFGKLNCYMVHTKVKSWSLSKYKKYISVVAEQLNRLKEKGIKEVYAVPPTEKEEKWQMLFGFKDSGIRLGQYKLMRLQNGN